MANLKSPRKIGMQGLEEQLNSRPAAEPFQPAAYEQPQGETGRPQSAKAAGMQAPQEQRAVGTQNTTPVQSAAGMDGLGQQLGQAKAVGMYSKYDGIDPLKQGASAGSLDTANQAYGAAGGEATRPQKVEWQGPIRTGPTGFVNYSDFRGANAGDIGASADRYRSQLGALQKAARDAALKYEKSQSPEDRAAWLKATEDANSLEQTDRGGSRLDRLLGGFTGSYDKANASWDAERKDLGVDVTNEEYRSASEKAKTAREKALAEGRSKEQADAAAAAQAERQAKADKLNSLQGKWREMTEAAKNEAKKKAAQDALASGGGAWQANISDSAGAMYASFDAANRAASDWDEQKKAIEDEINKLKQELS